MYRPTPYDGSLLRLALTTSVIFALLFLGLSYVRGSLSEPAAPAAPIVRLR